MRSGPRCFKPGPLCKTAAFSGNGAGRRKAQVPAAFIGLGQGDALPVTPVREGSFIVYVSGRAVVSGYFVFPICILDFLFDCSKIVEFHHFFIIFEIYIIMWKTLWIMCKTLFYRRFQPVTRFFMSPFVDPAVKTILPRRSRASSPNFVRRFPLPVQTRFPLRFWEKWDMIELIMIF